MKYIQIITTRKEEQNTPFYEAAFTHPANFWFDKFKKIVDLSGIMGGMGFSTLRSSVLLNILELAKWQTMCGGEGLRLV